MPRKRSKEIERHSDVQDEGTATTQAKPSNRMVAPSGVKVRATRPLNLDGVFHDKNEVFVVNAAELKRLGALVTKE